MRAQMIQRTFILFILSRLLKLVRLKTLRRKLMLKSIERPRSIAATSKSRKTKRAPRLKVRDEDRGQDDANDVVDDMPGTGKESREADESEGDGDGNKIDELPGDGDEVLGAEKDVVEAEAPDDADQSKLTRSNDDHPLMRIGIWNNHEDAQKTLNGNIDMDIVVVAEIMSEDEIKYFAVPSWFVNGISIGHFGHVPWRGKVVKKKDLPRMARQYTPDRAFAGLRPQDTIRERLLKLQNDANTKDVSLDKLNKMGDEEKDDDLLIQPPMTPEPMNGVFPPASTAKSMAKPTTNGKKNKADDDVATVVYFVDNVAKGSLPLEPNRQLPLELKEDFTNFDKWLLDGQGDYTGIGKGIYNEVDEGGWNLYIEYEVFVLTQRAKKDGRMWNWKKQPNRTVASFLNASMEEEYGRKLYIEVHLNVHPDAENMDEERTKRFESDPSFAKRVSKADGQQGGGSGRKGVAIKTSSSKLKTKKSQEDLPAKKGVARKKTSAAAKGKGTKTAAAGKKAQIDEDENEHSDEL